MDLMEVYKHLTDQEREEYSALEEMMSSKGWGILVKRAEEAITQLITYGAAAPNWDENRTALGMKKVWERLANLREATDFEYAELARQRAEPDTDEEVDDLDYE